MIKEQARRILNRPRKKPLHSDPKGKALGWLRNNSVPSGGVIVHSKKCDAYPEVTGYCIPTLIDCGEHELAGQYVAALLKLQDEQGHWGLEGKPYIFDTAQIVEGLSAWQRLRPDPDTTHAIDRALTWCSEQVDQRGMFNVLHHDSAVPELIQLRSLRNLHQASVQGSHGHLADTFKSIACKYLELLNTDDFNILSHFKAYVVDGVSWFDSARAGSFLLGYSESEYKNSVFPAYRQSKWFCLPAIAQFGILFWQHQMHEQATECFDFLCKMQRRSGGFTGGNGKYFPRVELSWAAKFFIDLANLVQGQPSDFSSSKPGGGE